MQRLHTMSIAIRKTRAKIFTYAHSTDNTSTMTVEITGTDVTARVMTMEDGLSSRRVKVNAVGPGTGLGRAVVTVTCAGLSSNQFIDVDQAPIVPATFNLVTVSDEVDPD